MKKKTFGLALIGLLVVILIVNVIQDTQKKKEEAAIQEMQQEMAEKEAAFLQTTGLTEGEAPPPFELETLEGEAIRLSDYKGKKVILNFWATWCPPCKAEMPHMQNFYENQAEEMNTEIIAVNLTHNERALNKHEKIREFIEEYGLTFPIPLDEDGEIGDAYRTLTIPTTYMIDTEGLIHKKIVGPMDENMMEQLVSEMD